MAKATAPKRRTLSTHSRAFRRAASPPPKNSTTAKSSKSDQPENEHWLYSTQAAGVHKKATKTKSLTRQQRQRQIKALEHADRNMSKHETKVEKSKQRARKVQERAKAWEEIDGVTGDKAVMAQVGGADAGDEEWEDEIDGEDEMLEHTEQDLDAIIAEDASRNLVAGTANAQEAPVSTTAGTEPIDEIT